jgi:hypothetical protein
MFMPLVSRIEPPRIPLESRIRPLESRIVPF